MNLDYEIEQAAKERIKNLISNDLSTIQTLARDINIELVNNSFYKTADFTRDMNKIRLKMENIEKTMQYFEEKYKSISQNFQV